MSTSTKKIAAVAIALSIALAAGGAATASPYGDKEHKQEQKVEAKEGNGKSSNKSLEIKGKSAKKSTVLSYSVNPGSLSGTVKTDKQGNYEFTVKVAAGTYTVVVDGQSSVITVK